ncbi:MAG: succinylglutamate desuccinylase/aspartoacylase family protein, partial [Fulvivirga sp.]
MVKIHSRPLGQAIEISRIIGQINGGLPGPTIIFTAGIHGNEPSGIFALKRVLEELGPKQKIIRGNIFAISGN